MLVKASTPIPIPRRQSNYQSQSVSKVARFYLVFKARNKIQKMVLVYEVKSVTANSLSLLLLVILTGGIYSLYPALSTGVAKNGRGEFHDQIDKPDANLLDGRLKAEIETLKATIATVFPKVSADSDPDIRMKRETVRNMMKHAWDNYANYAWGKNELRPISQKGHDKSVFGSENVGASIVDGLDTLFIMGLTNEFNRGRDWIEEHLNLTGLSMELSVFETNIRFVGGLLSAFALTGDSMFREKALHIAEKLLPAFNTLTGIPHSLINIGNGQSKPNAWHSSGDSILSELGSLSLEFTYLSEITGNPIFRQKIEQIILALKKQDRPDGLYPNYLNPETGRWGQRHVSMGALGDSFYEYLLKSWLQSGKQNDEARAMYVDAMNAVTRELSQKSKGGLTYFAQMESGRIEHKMEHLACFSGGMLVLGAEHLEEPLKTKHRDLGIAITHTCHESYDRTNTKLGPEAFRFSDSVEAEALTNQFNEKYYILRPEVIESYFVLWRLTHDVRYRQWGWEAVQAIEKHCRVDGGYTGIDNVYSDEPTKDDVQQSYFIAETLKYLYLLFSDDDLISLDQWVFNTEAHPLPIKGINPLYRSA